MRILIIDNCNIIVLFIYISSKIYINRTTTTQYITTILTYFVIKISIQTKNNYLFNSKDFLF